MTKIISTFSTLLLLFSVFSLRAQAADCEEPFVYFYGEGADYDARTLLSQDTFLYLGGQKDNAAFISKMTTNGELIWTQEMTPYSSLPNAIVDLKLASDGTLIGCGQAREGSDIESFAFKIDPVDGTPVWTQTYEDPNTDYFAATDIFETTSNASTYILLGTAFNNTATNTGCDAAFYSVDRNNGHIASERIHYHLGSCDGIESAVYSNGSFFTTGSYNFANSGFNRMRSAVSSFNTTGTPLWSRLYLVDINQDARLYSDDIALDGSNRLVVLARGDDNGVAAENADVFLYTVDRNIGGLVLARKYTFPENVISQEITVVENGYLIVATAPDTDRTYLLRVNGVGTPIWGKRLDGIITNGVGDELVVSNNLAYLAGQYIGANNQHAALLRFDVASGELPGDCISSADFMPVMSSIPSAYDGFNSLSTYNTAVAEAGSFDLEASSLAELPTSCGPACGPEICDNGIDDDGNGLTDCEDPVCDCIEICDNGIDDDGNGLADCEDPACDCEEECDSSSFALYIGTESENEEGDVLLALPNGNVLVGGGGESAIQLLEITPTGVIVSDRKVNTNGRSYITDLDFDSDGMIIGCGRTFSGSNVQSAMVFRYDYDNDNFLWYQTTAGGQGAYSVLEPVAGGDITLVGLQFNSPFPGGGDDTSWQSFDRNTGMPTTTISKNIALSGPESFYQSIVHENKIYHVGRIGFSNNPADFRAVVACYNTSGNQEWIRSLHLPNSVTARLYAYDIVVEDSFIYAFGSGDDDGTSLTNSQLFLYKLTLDGTLVWTKKYDIAGLANEWAHSILVVDDGILLYGDEEGGDSDIFLLKVNKEGEFQWGKRYLTDGQERLNGIVNQQIIEAANSLYFVAISNELSTNGSEDILLIHSDLNGVIAGDCLAFEEVQVNETTVSTAVATPVSLNEYGNTFDFSQQNTEFVAGINDILSSCLVVCEEICDNGIDDDGDGLTDCDDPDVADDCCCYEAPVLNLGTEGSICAGGELEIDAGPGFETYSWSDGSGGQTLTVSNSGFYSVTVTDICQTQQIDTFSVNVLPAFSSTQSITICEGETADIFGNPESEPGQYTMTFTATNGCDSIHTVTLSVLESFMTNENQTICAGSSTEIFGETVTEAGDYSMTFTAGNGCDSTHTVSVMVLEVLTTSEDQSICAGSSTEIFGETVTEAGEYSMTFTASNGCDSTHTVSVTVLEVLATSEDQSICAGSSTEIFGQTVTEAGDYSMTFMAGSGCDSTHTVSVTVLEVLATSEDQSICAGSSTEVFGQTVTEAGDYSMTFMAGSGCDSTHTVSVTVLEVLTTSEDQSICAGSSIEIFGQTVTEAGDYSMTFTASNGCDSTHTVSITVLEVLATSEDQSICVGSSTEIFGQTVTEAGDYSMTFTAGNGCDSTHTVSITVLEVLATSEDQSICAGSSTEIFGQTVTEAGDYSMTFTAGNGCDSTHTVSVTVLENIATSESFENLCAASSIEVFGEIITESGVFEQTYTAANGCDSTHTVAVSFLPPNVTMEEITICPDESIDIFGETVTEEGVYTGNFTGIDGCDSTHVITLISEIFSSFANIYPPCPGDPMLGWLVYIRTTGNGGPYTVTYNGQLAYSNTIGGLQPGDHTAQVTSANGCEYTVDFTIRDYSQPWSPLVADFPTNNEPYGGSIQMEVADDLGPITFSIDGVNYYEKPVFEGLSKGEYTLYVDYGGYCSFCTPVTVAAPEEDHSTTIAETANKDKFTAIPTTTAAGQERVLQLYPNPARQTFSLRGVDKLNLKTVRLLTLTGSPLKSWMAAEAGTVLSLPGNLPDGVYLIQTITLDGTTEYQKLVVAK